VAEVWTAPRELLGGLPDSSSDGVQWGPMFPLGVGPQPDSAERIPNVSLTVQHVNHFSPVGTIRYFDRFVDGRLTERRHGLVRHPDLIVTNTFHRMVASLRPDQPLLEAIEGARVAGRDASLVMVAASLFESNVLRAHINHRPAEADLLCALATHTQSAAWLAAVR
jgi:hypothetical protein